MALTRVQAQIDGQWYTLTYNAATARYEASVTLESSYDQPGGYYSAAVEATNDSGQTATASGSAMQSLRLVVRDETAPALAFLTPGPGAAINTSRTQIVLSATDTGTGIDLSTFTLAIDGEAVTDYTFQAVTNGYQITYTPTVGLADGAHIVFATVSDNDGNSVEQSLYYVVDTTTAPDLTVAAPLPNTLTDIPNLAITGAVSDTGSGLSGFTINGVAVAVTNGGFSYDTVLAEGGNTYLLAATDFAGNRTERSLTVTLDTAPPVLQLDSPAEGAYVAEASVALSGLATDSGSGMDHLVINGEEVPFSGGPFTRILPLTEGTNTISVTAVDRFGRTASVTRNVVRDTIPPVLHVHERNYRMVVNNSRSPPQSGR